VAYLYTSDAYSPQEIARRVEAAGIIKAAMPPFKTFMLGVLAGGFIGLGGLFATFIVADSAFSPMTARLLAGLFFASGYIMAILGGAEVFTSNNLLAMAWAAKKITFARLLLNWAVVLAANAVGAFGLIALFLLSGLHSSLDGLVGRTAWLIGAQKAELTLVETFARAVLGNLFVCVAVWISLGGRSMADKVLGVILPLSALAAMSLEHVVASLYYVPRAAMISWLYPEYLPEGAVSLSWWTICSHFGPVIAGNIVGGSLMVATVYHVIYRRGDEDPPPEHPCPQGADATATSKRKPD
jgi:formate transporter